MLMVHKYGGSSLADANRLMLAASRVAQQVRLGHRLVAVVSAQGDTTDEMLLKAAQVSRRPSKRELDAYLWPWLWRRRGSRR